MRPSKLRILLGLSSLITLAVTLFIIGFLSIPDKTRLADIGWLTSLKIVSDACIILVWTGVGKVFGWAMSFVLVGFSIFLFADSYDRLELYYIFASAFAVAAGYCYSLLLLRLRQRHRLESENCEGLLNVLRNDSRKAEEDITHLENRLERYINLSELTEKFSSSLPEEQLEEAIVESTYGLFRKSDRVLLYRVDTSRQELKLVYSKRAGSVPYIRHKKGDIFDRWVFWKKQPLIVENAKKDFRFAPGDVKSDTVFSSIISAPIISGNKVLGLVRMDSAEPSFYTQEDLRLLDIVSDLASVALENAILYKRMMELAVTDSLTSLYVHKYFMEKLEEEIKRARKAGTHFAVSLMDIDNFKGYNDEYGHLAGDMVLRHIAGMLARMCAGGDIICRYGGEEFAILMLGKGVEETGVFLETLRAKIEKTPILLRRTETFLTVSIGASFFSKDGDRVDELVRVADRRLYKAKARGKNKICIS